MKKKVITIKNEELNQERCRKFEKGWYKIGNVKRRDSGDCYLIDGSYYRIETGRIVFDIEVQEYVVKHSNICFGVVDLDKNGKLKFDYFSITVKNAKIYVSGGICFVFNEKIFQNSNAYREKLSDGIYYHISDLKAHRFSKIVKPDSDYKRSLPYDSKRVMKEYLEQYNKLDVNISKKVKNYARILEDLTFGLEFETVAGLVPDRLLNQTGLIPLRDGSIQGIEYVTVPMQGSKGVQTLLNATKELNKRTLFNDSCALHLHLGNIPRTKEFILSFFKLTCHLQEEIFQMFPLVKKYNFGIKNKNYSSPYPIFEFFNKMDPVITSENLDRNFDILFTRLSMGTSLREFSQTYDLNDVQNHPRDPRGEQKWYINTRYYFHNLIPLIFGNKTTIEFRIHTPTYDENKILFFMFLNALIVKFVKTNSKQILENPNYLDEISLSNLIRKELKSIKFDNQDQLIIQMLDNIENRKEEIKHQSRQGLINGKEDHIKSYVNLNLHKNNKNINTSFETDPFIDSYSTPRTFGSSFKTSRISPHLKKKPTPIRTNLGSVNKIRQSINEFDTVDTLNPYVIRNLDSISQESFKDSNNDKK